ncbi:MAG: metallopeptidase family protein [Acidimicrobiia bacterium]|nr:metallopeptidase family protein [Acidimicrobiia bacterium]
MVDVPPDRFDELVDQALERIPDELARHMENVVVIVEERPTPGQQAPHPGSLLGLYEGVELTRRSPSSYTAVMPDRITIFAENHRRICRTEEELRERIARTVVHEVGHHFGIDDARLRELGW